MPKAAQYRLVWSNSQAAYQIHDSTGQIENLTNNNQFWANFLANCTSFGFQGRQGRLTLLKEMRNQEKYWYAYRRQGKRTNKKYAGPEQALSIESLEKLAEILNQPVESTNMPKDVPQEQPVTTFPQPVLALKLNLPRLQIDILERERLYNRLDNGLKRKLSLVQAPAGFGKTTLVRSWLASRQQKPDFPAISWLTLAAAENDLSLFWRYILAACQNLQLPLSPATWRAWQNLSQASSFSFGTNMAEVAKKFLVALLNDLAQTGSESLLILEDFHTITLPQLHQAFQFFIEHLPPTLHLLIISRNEPKLPLARLRALNELSELQSAELRFTTAEIQSFLAKTAQITLLPGEINNLNEKLGGWAAGLRLLTLTLDKTDTNSLATHLKTLAGGSQRAIFDYFIQEVLNAQSSELQNFLLRTSLLAKLTPELCNIVCSNANSHELLENLLNANLFIEVTEVSDSSLPCYSYHTLFAEALQQEARRRLGPNIIQTILEQASRWYADRNMLTEAIEVAFGSHNTRQAAELVEQFITESWRGYVKSNDIQNLRNWIELLPETIFNEHPNLHLIYAQVLLYIPMPAQPSPPQKAQIAQSLDIAEAGFQAVNNIAKLGEVAAFRSLLARQNGDRQKVMNYAQQALAWLPPDEIAWRSWSLGVVGVEALLQGQVSTARMQLLEARRLGELEANPIYLRANAGMLSGIYADSGQLLQAEFYIRRVLEEARAENDLDDIAHAQLGLAQLLYEWNDVEAAQQAASEALDLAQRFANREIEVGATLALARIEQARNQPAEAMQRCAQLIARLEPHTSPLTQRLLREAFLVQAWLNLQNGSLTQVRQWQEHLYEDINLSFMQHEREQLLIARLLLAENKIEQLENLLNPLLTAALEAGRQNHALQIRLLLALALSRREQTVQATEILADLLPFTATQKYRRLFLNEGAAMENLLRLLLTKDSAKNQRSYLQALLEDFNAGTSGKPESRAHKRSTFPEFIEPLSRQEEKVLRLLVAGQTNPEIARELTVSVNTIRTQVQSIYRKLGVNNRRAAGERAKYWQLF